ncbi:MAG: sulfite exporter TauE/SafE family protein [Rhodospirillales bacterium]|nr:sulfite exporter TauE/SafE family protein [Rhodospirillales bacterium]
MTYYVMIFFAGLAGSFHCLGMCGGFACALGSDPRGRTATVARHLLYNMGRVTTYAFLGGLAGSAAGALVAYGTPGMFTTAQQALALVAGLLMVTMALQLFGFLRRWQHPWAGIGAHKVGFGGDTLVVSLRSLLAVPHHSAPLAFGVLNGFLPCPLVYAFVAQAAALCISDPSRGVLTGILTMLAFGLGTFPAMLLMGGVGGLIKPVWRRRGVYVAGAFILVLGLITLSRGFLPFSGHLHPL